MSTSLARLTKGEANAAAQALQTTGTQVGGGRL